MRYFTKFAGIAAVAAVLVSGFTGAAVAQSAEDPDEITMRQNARTYWQGETMAPFANDGAIRMPSRPKEDYPKNMMVEQTISAEAKMAMMQSVMPERTFFLTVMNEIMSRSEKGLNAIIDCIIAILAPAEMVCSTIMFLG